MLSIKALDHMKVRDPDLYWAVLLHDAGKYPAYGYDNSGNIHYYNHENESVRIFKDFIAKKIPFSNESVKKISWIIGNHIRVGTIESMKRLKRYRFMMNPYFDDLIKLYTVDNV